MKKNFIFDRTQSNTTIFSFANLWGIHRIQVTKTHILGYILQYSGVFCSI